MKSDKELYELFRRNQYGLNERPSPNAWNRLERRLDAHQNRQRQAFRRTLSMAAGLVFIVFIVGLLSLYSNGKADKWDYHTQYIDQTIEANGPADQADMVKMVNLSHQYQAQLAGKIDEGNPAKKLVARKDVSSD